LPAAGFDDCEHRLIPSCSIPASDMSGPAFSSVVMGSISARLGCKPLKATQKQTAREISRAGSGTYSRWMTRVKEKQARNEPNIRDLAH
jgi:hypothetical protein